MCLLKMPILKELSWVIEGVDGLDIKLSKPQKANLIRFLTAVFILGTTTLSAIASGWLNVISVNALSHFMSYSWVNGELLMAGAVRFAAKTMNLMCIEIRLAIDDTMEHHSRFCKCIANVYNLFDHVTNTYCQARCVVFAYLVVNECIRFPIGWRVYRQGGKKKWELAIELVDQTLAFGFKISVVLFDSWYCIKPVVEALERRNLKFISELKSNYVAEFRVENSSKSIKLPIEKLFSYGVHLCKQIYLGLKSANEQKPERTLYKTQSLTAYVPAFEMKLKIVKSEDVRKGCYKLFVTNELSWEAQKMLEEYSYRWLIEEFFRNAKQFYGFEEASTRSEQGGALKFFLVSFADLLVSLQLWKSTQKNSHKRLQTVSAVLAHAAEENLKSLFEADVDHEKLQLIIENWLGICHAIQRKTRRDRRYLAPVNTENTSCEQPAEAAA